MKGVQAASASQRKQAVPVKKVHQIPVRLGVLELGQTPADNPAKQQADKKLFC